MAWTEITRPQISGAMGDRAREEVRYASDTPDEEWAIAWA